MDMNGLALPSEIEMMPLILESQSMTIQKERRSNCLI